MKSDIKYLTKKTKKMNFIILLLLMTLILIPIKSTMARPNDWTLYYTSSGTFLYEGNTTAINYNNATYFAGIYNNESYYTLFEFDVSEYSVINSAVLSLYVISVNGTLPANISINAVTSSWQTTTANWNNTPSFNTNISAIMTFETNNTGRNTVDITSIVQDWDTGELQNYGILLNSSTNFITFYSYINSLGVCPYLDIHYTPPISEGTFEIIIPISILFIGFSLSKRTKDRKIE